MEKATNEERQQHQRGPVAPKCLPGGASTVRDSSMMNGSISNHLQPNEELTDQEKSHKRGLKRLLKRQRRRKKLETRLHQAIQRNDAATEEVSRKELEIFLKEEEKELLKTQSLLAPADVDIITKTLDTCWINSYQTNIEELLSPERTKSDQEEADVRTEIEFLYQRFYKIVAKQQKEEHKEEVKRSTNGNGGSINQDAYFAYNLDAVSLREKQTAEARLLLLNMTKGTQEISMFENQSALMGYVRQKWGERACLSVSSLYKLDPRRVSPQPTTAQLERQKQILIWKQLLAVRSICSIGCGPGCDAVGIIQFLKQFARPPPPTITNNGTLNQEDEPPLRTTIDRVVFLDWTMDKWEFFLQPLIDQVLIPNNSVSTADLAFCNVLEPLSDSSNASARGLLLQQASCSQGNRNLDDNTMNQPSSTSTIDLFVTSYLLTETRGKWHAFYTDMIAMAKPGALFLFAEPTAWQLLTLTKMKVTNNFDFVWLDSSMHSPILQSLEGRVSAAVLIGRKRSSVELN